MSEESLLEATRDHLRRVCGFSEAECEVEYDELAPAEVGQLYVAVCPNGWEPGPNSSIGGGVIDEIYGIEVAVVVRSPRTPRDRKRGLFLDRLTGVNHYIRIISAAIHFNPELMQAAAALNTGTNQSYTEMFKFAGADPKPRPVPSEFFAARPGEEQAGFLRAVRFHGARWIQYRDSMQ